MERKANNLIKMARAVRDLVIDATEEELRSDLAAAGEDFDEVAAHGQSVVERALAVSGRSSSPDVIDLHKGLGALIRMLRRRDQLTLEDLAETARVDPVELRAIESDPDVTPHPRTIYRLEQHFKLRPRTLVVLSGAVTVEGEVREEAVRFAASSTAINKLGREEKKLLNQFVKFLRDRTDR